jgi:2'-5' RNA ligase
MSSPGLESALIIEIPEAEPAVRRYRERFDANASLGIPAHITVLAPFMPSQMIDASLLTRLGQIFAGVGQFQFRLDRTDWFGDQVLWLAPGEPGLFRDLTQRVFHEFPAFPPFEGKHDVIVPHLTVGYGHALTDMRAAEEAIQASLPIQARAAAVTLMTEQSSGGHWTTTATFNLAYRRSCAATTHPPAPTPSGPDPQAACAGQRVPVEAGESSRNAWPQRGAAQDLRRSQLPSAADSAMAMAMAATRLG